MEDFYKKILWDGYGLQLRGTSRIRTGLVCRTDQGLWELKKSRGHKENLYFAFDVKEQLRKNGFTQIGRFYPTQEGEPFYQQDGVLYTLEDVMPAEALAEDCAASFIRGAEALGQMHAAAKGLKSTYAQWDREKLPKRYAKRRSGLAKIKKRSEKNGTYDAIDLLLLQYYGLYMEQTAEAEELLKRGGYAQAVEQAEQTGAFCHGAYKGESLRLLQDGSLCIGGFDQCEAELPLADLAAYLKRYMKKTDGQTEGVTVMLHAFEKHYPLSEKDILLLQGMLLYPEKFLRLINEYYNRRRACISPAMEERLQAAAQDHSGWKLKGILSSL